MQTNDMPYLSESNNRRYASAARDMLFAVLDARGISLTPEQRAFDRRVPGSSWRCALGWLVPRPPPPQTRCCRPHRWRARARDRGAQSAYVTEPIQPRTRARHRGANESLTAGETTALHPARDHSRSSAAARDAHVHACAPGAEPLVGAAVAAASQLGGLGMHALDLLMYRLERSGRG